MKFGFYFQFLELLMSMFLMILGQTLYAREYVWSVIFLILSIMSTGFYLLMVQIINKSGTIILPFWFSMMPKKFREKVLEALK